MTLVISWIFRYIYIFNWKTIHRYKIKTRFRATIHHEMKTSKWDLILSSCFYPPLYRPYCVQLINHTLIGLVGHQLFIMCRTTISTARNPAAQWQTGNNSYAFPLKFFYLTYYNCISVETMPTEAGNVSIVSNRNIASFRLQSK